MKYILKVIITGIILGVMELVFYLLLRPKGFSVFFLIWILINFVLLTGNVFGTRVKRFDGSYFGAGFFGGFGDLSRYDIHKSAMVETTFNTEQNNIRRRAINIKDPLNMVFLVYLIINILIFIADL